LTHPQIAVGETSIVAVQPAADGIAVALGENLFRAAGGGEPADRGELLFGGDVVPVRRVVKNEGTTWAIAGASGIGVGQLVTARLDQVHRLRKRRHSD